jgi:uncharacterized protein YjdB
MDGEMSLSAWNTANPDNQVAWTSMHTDTVTVNPATGYVTAHKNGAAIILASVVDKWGVQQSIPVLVTVG